MEVALTSRRASILVAGEPADTINLATALLEQLCKSGYQACVLDTRGDYLNFKPAIAFGTLDNPTVAGVSLSCKANADQVPGAER